MIHDVCESGWNRAVTKGTLLLRTKHFFFHTSPHIGGG
jgi:hypothetical protein